jgi:hypothetical protein
MKFDFNLARLMAAGKFCRPDSPSWIVRIANSDDKYPNVPDFPPRFASTSWRCRNAPTRSTLTNHTLGKAYLPDERQHAKYSELGRARNMTIADIEFFSMLRTG